MVQNQQFPGILMKIKHYGAPQLVKIESRFISKLLPEHSLSEFLFPSSASRCAKEMVTHDIEDMCCS